MPAGFPRQGVPPHGPRQAAPTRGPGQGFPPQGPKQGRGVTPSRGSSGRQVTPPTTPAPKRLDMRPTPPRPGPSHAEPSTPVVQAASTKISKKAAAKEADRVRKASQRANETQGQREARLERHRDQTAAVRAQETEAQRKARQEADKERTAKSRAAETEAQKKARQEANRIRTAQARAAESAAQREERLKSDKERKAASNRNEAPKVRGERPKGEWTLAKEKGGLALREFERKKQKERLSRETPEERENRLQKMREYSASRRANNTIKISSKVREATRERVAALRAKRTPEEVQHDREKAKEGMKKTWERRSDYTADEWADICRNRKEIIGGGQRRGKHHHDRTCPVRMWRLKVAAGTEAGPEPMYNGRLQNCHYCDQDMELPLAGEARCWKTGCYTCSKLFGIKRKEGEDDEA